MEKEEYGDRFGPSILLKGVRQDGLRKGSNGNALYTSTSTIKWAVVHP